MTKKSLDWQKLLAPSVLVLLYIFFSFAGTNFFSVDYLMNILNASYFIGFMAIGVTFVIIRGIDLSLGTTMMCGALLGATAYSNWGWNIWISLAFCVFVATVIGVINGWLIAYLRLPPFIATLGMQMIGMGFGAIVTKVITKRFPTIGTPDAAFKYVFYKSSNTAVIPGFPTGALWLIGAFIVAYVLLNHTKFGRYTYALGSNFEAARLSGINVKRWQFLIYTSAASAAWPGCSTRRCIPP